MDRPDVHVVIVNWNSGPQLRECLQSFETAVAGGITVQVTVVDNASSDGSCDGLMAPAGVTLDIVRNAQNRGFGTACNQGAAGTTADLILFLNPDTRLMRGSIATAVAYMRSPENQGVGILGIQLIDENGHVARDTARMPTAWSMIGNSLGLDRVLPALFPPHFVTEWPHDETRAVDQVMGAFFLVRASVFAALGGFDERFFVYFEDLDFALRARQRGWSSVYLATAQAFHKGQGTTRGATQARLFYFARSKLLFARKTFGVFGAFAVTAVTLILEPIARIVASPGSASVTIRAFAQLWGALPAILAQRK